MAKVLVGLTGGIGSGKSEVADLLAQRGARVIDADTVAREVVGRDSDGLRAVVEEFGTGMLDENGELDRARMADIVFADVSARQRLNAIVHPLVAARVEALLVEDNSAGVVVYDLPLMVEGSVQDRHDFALILVVETPEELRIQRLMRDRKMTEAQIRARMSTQATDEQRRDAADVVIVNSGNRADLARAVHKVWQERIRPAKLTAAYPRPGTGRSAAPIEATTPCHRRPTGDQQSDRDPDR